jgi:N-acetylglucosamine-6-phosphate deacetylase
METLIFRGGTIVLEDRLLPNGQVQVVGDRISAIEKEASQESPIPEKTIDLKAGYLSPGYVDLHVHGGAGADFMDGTADAFQTVCRAHCRHGTTSLLPTTTAARHDQHLAFLKLCQRFRGEDTGGARVLGAHFYGPYFAPEARGCHPATPIRPPRPEEYRSYLDFSDSITTATVAPEVEGAEAFVRTCRARGIRCNAGHSYATFDRMKEAIAWGVRHVDHLFCAMSDRARLRQSQAFPMRGGVMEATLFFDELSTEVIADGKHLNRELLMLAYKIKGLDRLALVTDCNRALDMPDGDYMFGPVDGGEPILRRDGVGVMPDGKALASGVMGMDHCVRTFYQWTGAPLPEVIRMASLTPAKIGGWDTEVGSITKGKLADLLVLDKELRVMQVYRAGRLIWADGE